MRASFFAFGAMLILFPATSHVASQGDDSPVKVKLEPGKVGSDGKQVVRVIKPVPACP